MKICFAKSTTELCFAINTGKPTTKPEQSKEFLQTQVIFRFENNIDILSEEKLTISSSEVVLLERVMIPERERSGSETT